MKTIQAMYIVYNSLNLSSLFCERKLFEFIIVCFGKHPCIMPLGRSLKPKALKKMACLLIHLNAARIRTASYGWTDDMCAIYPQKRALLSHISNGGGGGSKE